MRASDSLNLDSALLAERRGRPCVRSIRPPSPSLTSLGLWRGGRFPRQASWRAAGSRRRLDEAIRQRLQKRHQVILLGGRQTEFANDHVLIVKVFRHRPAGHFLDRPRGAVPGEHRLRVDVSSVVEVDYLLETE